MDGTLEKVPGTKFMRETDTNKAVQAYGNPHGNIMLFPGAASEELCAEIAQYLKLDVGESERMVFPNENIFVRLKESVRGQDVYVVQSMVTPLHDNLMEMLIMVDALKRGEIEPPVNATEGTKSLSIIHALYRSMEDNGWVTVGTSSKRLGIGG